MAALVGLLLCLPGCAAHYATSMKGPLKRLQRGDYAGALEKLQKPMGDTNKLLYRLERGLILHYQGEYDASNRQLAKAEGLIDKHYTRSVSREIASLMTNDAIRPYSGEEFERALVHYYRAMNYWKLGEAEGALVECRKANERLARFASGTDYELSYRNDAFLQYMTGLFFEAEGEWNDAYISYRDAERGYEAYAETFGMSMPQPVAEDLVDMADRLGYYDEVDEFSARYHLPRREGRREQMGEVVVFGESGFVARKGEMDISVPIQGGRNAGRAWAVSERAVYRYHHPYVHGKVDYWLKVALPQYRPVPTSTHAVRVCAGGDTARAYMMEDLDAIAVQSLEEKEASILLRTVARGVVKYAATKAAEKESDILGALVNLFGMGTEAADTRSWLSLPKAIWMGRLRLPPGTIDVVVEFLDEGGRVVDAHTFNAVELTSSRPVFLSHRSFR